MNGLETRGKTRIVLWALLAAALILYGFPFIYLLLTSFKTPLEAIAVPPTVLPAQWTLENYVSALSREGVPAALINSVITAVISTVLSLVLAVPAAYAITRFRTPSGRVFIVAALVTRMVPTIAVGAPLVEIMRNLGLTDTSFGLALAHTTISLPLSIWLMASFFEAVPDELDEAAKVDGCSGCRPVAGRAPRGHRRPGRHRDLRVPRLVERVPLRAAPHLGPRADHARSSSPTSRASSAWTGAA